MKEHYTDTAGAVDHVLDGEHISLTGDYVWTWIDALKGSFRPLRTGLSPFLRVT
jgi:hypothetical protein